MRKWRWFFYITVAICSLVLVVTSQWSSQSNAHAQTGTNCRTFPETGKTVCDRFLEYWNTHGGLTQQGFPIADMMPQVSPTDGKTYPMQYFERAVFELHSEFASPNDVLLSLLGVFRYNQKYHDGAPGQIPNSEPDSHLFTETGKHVGGLFLKYWNDHGGLAQQGYPISEEFQEVSDLNGQTYKVQYFQRAVFEWHPENAPPYDVLLSQLGTYFYQGNIVVDPTTTPPPSTPTNTPSPPTLTPTNPQPTPTAIDTGPPPRVSLADFKALYDDPATRPVILDVRVVESYEAGHIKWAISFPEADVDSRVGELPHDKLIVAYCQ